MTRKQMIETIAKEARCSKRLVRKKLFNRYLELKKMRPNILFYKAFLDKNTDWYNRNEGKKDWTKPNAFEVVFVSSGCVVLFRNISWIYHGEIAETDCGVRLYNW